MLRELRNQNYGTLSRRNQNSCSTRHMKMGLLLLVYLTRTQTHTLNVLVDAQRAGPPMELPTRSADHATRAARHAKIVMLRNVLYVQRISRCSMQPHPGASKAVHRNRDTMRSIRMQRATVIATGARHLVLSAEVTNRTAHGASGIPS